MRVLGLFAQVFNYSHNLHLTNSWSENAFLPAVLFSVPNAQIYSFIIASNAGGFFYFDLGGLSSSCLLAFLISFYLVRVVSV